MDFLKIRKFMGHPHHFMLQKGATAPDFELFCTPDQKLRLSELAGKKVILAFYPADWSPVCSDEMALYNQSLRFFNRYNAQLLGISVDSRWCHMAFSADRKLDFEPKGAVARLYGVYDAKEGECQRALFVLDEQLTIRWSYLSPVGVNPGADGILDALEEISQSVKA
jgi:peroxiredoxin